MPPIKFKLASKSKENVIRLALFDEQPSWSSLVSRISSIFEIPVGDVRVTYEDGDEITIATNQELQDYYQTLPPMLTNPIRFTVKDASIIQSSQRLASPGQYDLEDDWQRVPKLSPHVFTIPRPLSRESGAYVETVEDEEELAEVLPQDSRLESIDDDGESSSSVDSILDNDGPDKQPIHVHGFDGEPIPKQSAQPGRTPSAVSYASSPPTVPRRPRSRSLSSSSHEGNTRRPRSPSPEIIPAPDHNRAQEQNEEPLTRSTVFLDDKGSVINTPETLKSPLPKQLYVPEERPSRRARHADPDKQSQQFSASPLINFNSPALAPMILEVHPGGQRESILINLSPIPPRSPVLYPVENVESVPFKSTPGEAQESEGGAPDPASATVSPRSQPRVNIKVVDDPPLPTIPSEYGIDPLIASPEGEAVTVASLTQDVAQLLNSLTEAFAAHPELSAGLRNIIRNASQGAYWNTSGVEAIQQHENSGQRAAEEAGRRVAEALGGVFRALGGAAGEGISSSAEINSPKHTADMGVRVEVRRGEVAGSPQQTFSKTAEEKEPPPASSAGLSALPSRFSSSASSRTASPSPDPDRRPRSVSPSLERYPRRQPSRKATTGARSYQPPGVSIHRPGGIRQFIPLDGPDANIDVDIGAMWQSPRPDMRFGSPVAHPMFASGYYRRPDDPWGPRPGYWGGGRSVPRSATVPLRGMDVGPGGDFIGGFVPPTHVHPYASRPGPAEVPPGLGGSGVGMTGTSVTMSSVLPSSGVEMNAVGEGEVPPRPPRQPPSVHAPVAPVGAQPPTEESRRDSRPPSYEPAVAPGGTNVSLIALRDELEEAKKIYKGKKDAWKRQREAHKLEREIKEKQRAERRAVDYELRERQKAELQAFGIPIDPNMNGKATASPRRGGGERLLSHITESPLSRGSEIYTGSQPPPVPPKRNEPVETSSPPRPVPMSSAVVEKIKVTVMNRLKDMGVESSSHPSVEALVDQDIVKYQQEEAVMGRVLIQEHAEKIVRRVLEDLFLTPVTGNAIAGPSRSGKARGRRA